MGGARAVSSVPEVRAVTSRHRRAACYRHDGVHVEGDVHVEVHVAAAAVVVVDEEAMLWTIKVIAADVPASLPG